MDKDGPTLAIDEVRTQKDQMKTIETQSNLDERTQQIRQILFALIEKSNKDMRPFVVDGGLAIELFVADRDNLNDFYRNHGDLDIRPMENDIEYWKVVLKEMGFEIDDNIPGIDGDKAFTATKKSTEGKDNSFRIDIWGLGVDEDRRVYSSETGKKIYYEQSWDDLVQGVEWSGERTYIIRPEVVLKNKSEYARKNSSELRRGDLIDYSKAGINIPVENI